mgnify:CR=1 FL=1
MIKRKVLDHSDIIIVIMIIGTRYFVGWQAFIDMYIYLPVIHIDSDFSYELIVVQGSESD